MKGAYLKDQWIAFHVKIAGGKVTGERWRGYEAWSDPASMVLRGARGDEYLVVIPEPKEFTPVAGTDEMTVTTKMGSTWTFKLNSNIFRTSGDRQQLFFGKTACAGNLQTAAEAFRSLPWPN